MKNYLSRIFWAVLPSGYKEAIALSLFTPFAAYIGYVALIKDIPHTTVYTQTEYPKEAHRGDFLAVSVDLSFDQTCTIKAERIFTGKDGVDYLASQDEKDVTAGERMHYLVRIPVNASVPLGSAKFRSDLSYGCDIWSRYIYPRRSRGIERNIEILPPILGYESPKTGLVDDIKSASCGLEPKPGYTVVRSYYRKVASRN